MSKFIVGTFLILGWTFYEMSDGADFVPEERVVAELEAVEVETPVVASVEPEVIETVEPVIEIAVTRDEPSDILDLTTGSLLQPVETVVEAVAQISDVEPEVEVVLASIIEAVEETEDPLDIRLVSGSRVNMRSGPGTDYAVLDTLPGGTAAEVIEVDATGWARIRIQDTGTIGWMAERLLTES